VLRAVAMLRLASSQCHARFMRPSLFEFAGGEPAFLALAAALHQRCLDDPELNHPFSHPGGNPQHVERLAAYWAEVMGGPPTFSQNCTDQTAMLQLHAGNGDMTDLGRRFVACFMQAADDAALPTDADFRTALREYMEWAVADVLTYSAPDTVVPAGIAMPHWSWDGLQAELHAPTAADGEARA
jgi:hemoglobin